jgi:hypothetical protein
MVFADTEKPIVMVVKTEVGEAQIFRSGNSFRLDIVADAVNFLIGIINKKNAGFSGAVNATTVLVYA